MAKEQEPAKKMSAPMQIGILVAVEVVVYMLVGIATDSEVIRVAAALVVGIGVGLAMLRPQLQQARAESKNKPKKR